MVNIQQVMKQAQDLQKKMSDMQDTLAATEVIGISGSGLIKITTTGKGEVRKIEIDKSLLEPTEVEVLEDLIVAAFNNARRNADMFMNEEMQKRGISPELLKMGL